MIIYESECVQRNEYVHEGVFIYKEMNMYIGGLFMYKDFEYVHKRIGTYTVREAHDQLRNSRKTLIRFYLQVESIMEKGV